MDWINLLIREKRISVIVNMNQFVQSVAVSPGVRLVTLAPHPPWVIISVEGLPYRRSFLRV